MAQNISIQEGGLSKQFGQINKLKIANSGGGTSLWVPEDEVQTKSLHVDSNGTYYASQDECYGYDEVSVNITDECFGYDDDGNLWDVDVDEDDFLEEEEMPVRIEVTTPPTKTSYIVAEPINTAGMVVKAYYGDGTEWGEVPREEYTIDPLVAIIGSQHGGSVSTDEIDLSPFQQNIYLGTRWQYDDIDKAPSYPRGGYYNRLGGNGRLAIFVDSDFTSTEVGLFSICASKTRNGAYIESGFRYDYTDGEPTSALYTYDEYTYNGKTVYFRGSGITGYNPSRHNYSSDCGTQEFDTSWTNTLAYMQKVAWAMMYGTYYQAENCEVTVKWPRPEDGQELTATFNVNVTDPTPVISGGSSGGNSGGGGGSSGGSW